MKNNYDDIINLPHHVSERHPQMSLHDRAAQFAPFAALTGFDAQIEEAARLTNMKLELDEETEMLLNSRLAIILENISSHPEITVTYFVPDETKSGGEYRKFTGEVRSVDSDKQVLVFTDGKKIKLDDIYFITGENLF